jgi:succinate dehydrogenase / fumarate reductase cytochrome b subunit
MAITGVALILFLTFHVLMNAVAIFWPTAYNQVCEFLGANWYALVASAGLALLFIIHIIYAVWLTLQNRRARGTDRYAVTARQPQVEWSSKNMLVLGIVVLAFLVVHMVQFWAKMQLQELLHADLNVLPQVNGAPANPALGTLFIQLAFSEIWTPIVYIIGFVALWFHMNHGFWSMFHTIGWDNNIWIERLKKIALCWSSVVVGLFIIQAVVFTINANNKYYLENEALQQQYAETWNKQAKALTNEFMEGFQAEVAKITKGADDMDLQQRMQMQQEMQQLQTTYVNLHGKKFVDQAEALINACETQCTNVGMPENVANLEQLTRQIKSMLPPPAKENQPQETNK